MKLKKILRVFSAAAVLGLALFVYGCSGSSGESSKSAGGQSAAVGIQEASVGDVVLFGDIRWYVIAKSEAGCTLLSEEPVIKMPFNEAGYNTSGAWEDSTLRTWLNEKFYNTFTEEEKALIAVTHNINPENRENGTSGGSDTDDYIFLLSVDEANALDKKVRHCGDWYGMAHQWWWLRSPGANSSYTAYVGAGNDSNAKIDTNGDISGNDYGAVRPALNLRFADNAVPDGISKTPAEEESELAALADSQTGDVVAFGRYTWYVTDKTDDACTLLCQGPVAEMPYNDSKSDITWEKCSLRRWLNEDFYNSKFTDGEKAVIITAHNTFTEKDSSYEMDCGNDTDDKVYLFSNSESDSISDDIRDCGVDWWLRSPGKTQSDAVYILGRSANLMGCDVDWAMGVRPAIRVNY